MTRSATQPRDHAGRTLHWPRLLLFLALALQAWRPSGAFAAVIAEHALRLESGLEQPTDVAVSGNGDIYVLDGVNDRVVVFDHSGKRKFTFGEKKAEGDGLNLPLGIAVDASSVFVADTGNRRIALFSHDGRFLRGIAVAGEPVALALDGGDLIWSDRRHHRICRVHIATGKLRFCRGGEGEKRGQFRFPFQLLSDPEGYLHVVDVLNARVQIFDRRGRHFMHLGRFGVGGSALFRPNGLARDERGNLYVSDSYFGTIALFRNGRPSGLLLDPNGQPLRLGSPAGMTIRQGRLYVADPAADRIEIYRLRTAPVSSAGTAPATAADVSRRNCIMCHLSWSPDYVPPAGGKEKVPPVASSRMCYSCHHGAVVDSRRRIGQKAQHPDIHHPRDEKTRKGHKREDEIPEAIPLVENETLYCGSCHDPHVAEKDGGTLYDEHGNPWLRTGNHDGRLCQRCHASLLDDIWMDERKRRGLTHPVGTFLKAPPVPGAKGYATETTLHDGLPAALVEGGAALSPEGKMICQSCHQIHGGEGEALTVAPVAKAELCQTCHRRQHAEDRDDARRKGVHPVNVRLDEPVKLGEEKVEFITCLTCHSVHKGKRNTALLKFRADNGELCAYCHEGYDAVGDSDHDLRQTADDSRNIHGQTPEQSGLCGACHSLHRAGRRRPFLSAVEPHEYAGKEEVLERDRLCLDCHHEKGPAKEAVVERVSHPFERMVLRSNPEDMPLVDGEGKLAEFGRIGCVTCHDPHRWEKRDPGKEPAQGQDRAVKGHGNREGNVLTSFLRHKEIKGRFCVNCHGIEARPKYKYYHDNWVRSDHPDE